MRSTVVSCPAAIPHTSTFGSAAAWPTISSRSGRATFTIGGGLPQQLPSQVVRRLAGLFRPERGAEVLPAVVGEQHNDVAAVQLASHPHRGGQCSAGRDTGEASLTPQQPLSEA